MEDKIETWDDSNGHTALIVAASNGNLETIKYLIEDCIVDINHRDVEDFTAFMWAAINGHLKTVQYLKDQQAEINSFDVKRALIVAMSRELYLVVNNLIEIGTEIDSSKFNDDFITAVKMGRLRTVIDDETFSCALMAAAFYGFLETVKYSIEAGVNINCEGSDGITALMWAALGGHLEIVQYLIENGAKINDRCDEDLERALSWAMDKGNLKIVEYLITKGAILDPLFVEDHLENLLNSEISEMINNPCFIHSLLLDGVRSNRIYLIKSFVEIKNKLNIPNYRIFEKSLMIAAMNNQEELVSCLLANGININIKREGLTPLMLAAQFGCEEVVKVLVDKGADIYDVDNKGNKASIMALNAGNKSVAKFLINKEMDYDSSYDISDGERKSSIKRKRESDHEETES